MKRKIIIPIIAASIVILIILMDLFILIFTGNGPYLASKKEINNGNAVMYRAFLYNVWKCDVKNNPKEYVIKPFYKSYECKAIGDANSYTIVDESDKCDSALDEIARDDMYIYYFSCKKSDKVYLIFGDGTKVKIKEAVKSKKVTIDELYLKLKKEIFIEAISK